MSIYKPQPPKPPPAPRKRAGQFGALVSFVFALIVGGAVSTDSVRLADAPPQVQPPVLVSQPPPSPESGPSPSLEEPSARDSQYAVPLKVGARGGSSPVEKSTQTLINHTHNLHSHVSERGWEIEPLENRKGARPWRWRYSLKAVKRGKLASRVSEATLRDISQEGEQITIHRSDLRMDEWYRTTDLGIISLYLGYLISLYLGYLMSSG